MLKETCLEMEHFRPVKPGIKRENIIIYHGLTFCTQQSVKNGKTTETKFKDMKI
jgi:hypothetical protein